MAHIKEYRAVKLIGRDETTVADIAGTLMPITGGTVSILPTLSPSMAGTVVTLPSSTVQATFAVAFTSTKVWDSFNVSAGSTSAPVDMGSYARVGVMVYSSTNMEVRVLVSPDGDFWVKDHSVQFEGAGSIGWDCMSSARYYKLWTSAPGTVTAWFVGKSA